MDPLAQRQPRTEPQTWNRYAYAIGNPLRFIDPDGLEERKGWLAGTVRNKSTETIYVASDESGEIQMLNLKPGEYSADFVEDADAVVIANGQSINGKRSGAFKIASGDISIHSKSGSNGAELYIEGDLEFTILSAAGLAGYIPPEEAQKQQWVPPDDSRGDDQKEEDHHNRGVKENDNEPKDGSPESSREKNSS